MPGCGQAQEISAVIAVATVRDPDWKHYPSFVAGMDLFDAEHEMAPTAPLWFRLVSRSGGLPPGKLEMRIATDDQSEALELGPDGRFQLPRRPWALDGNAELLTNQRRGSARWRPDIRSPDIAPGYRRLGDLRLECKVRWAVERAQVPALMRKVFEIGGNPCLSRSVRVDFFSDELIGRVVVETPAGDRPLPCNRAASGGREYFPPLNDPSLGNDVLLRFDAAGNCAVPSSAQ
jgi:hypothetical protein